MAGRETRGGEPPLRIVLEDNLRFLRTVEARSVDLIYIDPPFNTGRAQRRVRIRADRDASGDRIGFGDRRYRTTRVAASQYRDRFDDYPGFLEPRLIEAHRVLADTGSLFFHIDPREAHYCKVLLDGIFGRASFMNEIVWAYDFGGRPKRPWPAKHDTIFWYAKDPARYTFHYDAIDRIPYMAPGLVGPKKAARGKTPTDVWWHTIVPTNSREKTGDPTQKPLGLIDRIVRVHSSPGDRLLDFFAGSGTFGEAALRHGRICTLADSNPEAVQVMARRLAPFHPVCDGFDPGAGIRRDPTADRKCGQPETRSATRAKGTVSWVRRSRSRTVQVPPAASSGPRTSA